MTSESTVSEEGGDIPLIGTGTETGTATESWNPTPVEWLALFPTAPDGPSPTESHLLGDRDAQLMVDLAAELRKERPITREVLERELAPLVFGLLCLPNSLLAN